MHAFDVSHIFQKFFDQHLIIFSTFFRCAFANTPKFNQVKGKGKIVSAKWIESCFSEQKRLPWRRFAMDRDDKNETVSEEEILCDWNRPKTAATNLNDSDSDGDMLIVDKRKFTPEKKIQAVGSDDDDDMVVVVKPPALPMKITIDDDESMQDVEMADDEQKENVEEDNDSESSIDITNVECEAFKGKTFYLNEDLPATTIIKFKHTIKYMLGIVTKNPSKANYIITKYGENLPKNACGEVVKDIWIQECHDLQAFIPTTRYKL
jgi:DNA-repair protein XRCC1